MKTIKIKNYPNFYYIEDEKICKYLSDSVLDLESKEFKPLKKTPYKDFSIQIRVTKVLDGKQKSKKKLIRFTKEKDNLTIKKALESLKDMPDEMLSQIKTDAEIQKLKKEEEAVQAKVKALEDTNRIINDIWDDFYSHKTMGAGRKWSKHTARNYVSFYNLWIRDHILGNTAIKEISKKECKNLIDEVAEIRAMRTATTVIEILRPMVDWYFDEYEIDKRNPVPTKKDYPFDNVRSINIELSEIRKIYQAMDELEDDLSKDVFKWMRTGRRRGEIAGLLVDNIDIKGSSFLVPAEINKAGIDMEYKLRDELRETIRTKSGKLFDIHADTISSKWKELVQDIDGTFKLRGKRCSISELHLHDLRHLISGILKKASVPEEIRAKVLGHKRTSITDRYGADYFDDTDKAYQLFLDIIYGVVPENTKWST